ncbi:MAG: hypothetical protein WBN80_03670 [Prochlorococcaceae cyanobacterium]
MSATAPLPWQDALPLAGPVELGPGLEPARLQAGLERLCRQPGINMKKGPFHFQRRASNFCVRSTR